MGHVFPYKQGDEWSRIFSILWPQMYTYQRLELCSLSSLQTKSLKLR
jgi:hypothetical protein